MRIISVVVLCGALALGGCAGGIPNASDPRVQQVIAAVQQGCSFAPAATSVANIIAALINGAQPVVDVVSSAVNSICGAVHAKSLRRGAPHQLTVVVNGQPIALKGQRI